MLVSKDYTGVEKSVYKCDVCGVKMYPKYKTSIHVKKDKKSMKKMWDLCLECYNKIFKETEEC